MGLEVRQPVDVTALAFYDATTGKWYAAAGDPDTGALLQRAESSQVNELRHDQVSVTSTGALIVAARAGRQSVVIKNHSGGDVYIGNINVSTGSGLKLAVGEGVTIPGSAAVYGRSLVNVTVTVSYMEVY